MTLHIQRFVDRVQTLESKGARDLVMPLIDAKNLQADLLRLLLELENLRAHATNGSGSNVITVQIDGGKF